MKLISTLSIAAVILLLVSLTPAILGAQDTAAASHANTANPVKPTPELQARAKEIYNIDCAMCHGANGNGKTDLARDMQLQLKDWTDPATFASKTDGQLFDIIRNGTPDGKMPPEAPGRAPDDVVWNIVHYIRGISAAK
jgi:mono/diheme cytochrome c family protein